MLRTLGIRRHVLFPSLLALIVNVPCVRAWSQGVQEVRDWLMVGLQGPDAARTSKDAVVIEWTVTRSSRLTSDDIESRWASVERYPDHPERVHIERHRELYAHPEQVHGRLVMLDPATWMLEENHASGYTFRCGGHGDARWMIAGGIVPSQLTIIKAGVAFPSMYNIGQFYGVATRYRSIMLGGWLDELPRHILPDTVEASASEWRAVLSSSDGKCRVNVRGDWCRSSPRVVRMKRFDSVGSRTELQTEFHAEYREDGRCDRTSRVVVDTPDFIREVYVLGEVAYLSQKEAAHLCTVPEVGESVSLVDFRESDSPARRVYAGVPQVVWTITENGDAYTRVGVDSLVRDRSSGISPAHRVQRSVAIALGLGVVAWVAFSLWRRISVKNS